MERDFKQWLALFRTSIANYQYYTYFDKVFSNVDAIKAVSYTHLDVYKRQEFFQFSI